jgi:hypothetical protein
MNCGRQFLVDVQTLVRRETDLWAREFERATQLLDQSSLDRAGFDNINPDQSTTTTLATVAPNQ